MRVPPPSSAPSLRPGTEPAPGIDRKGGIEPLSSAHAAVEVAAPGALRGSEARTSPALPPLPFAPLELAALAHGGRPLDRAPALVRATFTEPPRLVVLGEEPLVFDHPFGRGAGRHVGVRAASAIVRLGPVELVAQDDSAFAAVLAHGRTVPLRLFEGTVTPKQRAEEIAVKPDLESAVAMTLAGRPAAVLFGSGSEDDRMRAACVSLESGRYQVRVAELGSMYRAAAEVLGLPILEINLEGAALRGDEVLFFQRGNGAAGVNASFAIAREVLEAALLEGRPIVPGDLRGARAHDLGTLDGVRLTFSDAAPLSDGRILYLATAEASPSPNEDGVVTGSVLGLLDLDGTTTTLARIPDGARGPYKLEGLLVDREDGRTLQLRAVEDADDPARPSTSVHLRLTLPAPLG